MDQESGSGRRRSSRLAARGVVAPPKPEVVKTPKTEEKQKRSKRKQNDERPSSAAKKLKTEDEPVSSTPEKEECKTEENKVDTNEDQVDATAPTKVADVQVPLSSEYKDCTNAGADKTDVLKPQDPKEQDKTLQNLEEEEKTMDVDVPTPPPEEKKDAEEIKQVVQPVEPQKVKKIEEEPVTDAKVIGNGLSAEREAKTEVQPEKCEKEVKALVKESITSNGTVSTELKPTNGTGPKINSDTVETNEAVSGNKSHVTDCEYNQKSIAVVNNASNETAAAKEVASTESEKIIDNAVGNTTVSADSVSPNKDQSSTIQS